MRKGDFAGLFERFGSDACCVKANSPCSTRIPSMPRAASIASAQRLGLRADQR